MGLLEKSESILQSAPGPSGLAARARSILRRSRERRDTGTIDEGASFSPLFPPVAALRDRRASPAGRPRKDALAALMESAPDLSMILVYDIEGLVDPENLERSARKIVEGQGEVERAGTGSLLILLRHMESADPALTLAQFGKALVRTYAELILPPPGRAFKIDRTKERDGVPSVSQGRGGFLQ